MKRQRIVIEATSDEEARSILLRKAPLTEILTIKKKHYTNIFVNNVVGKWFEVKGVMATINVFTNKEKGITLSFLRAESSSLELCLARRRKTKGQQHSEEEFFAEIARVCELNELTPNI